MIINEIKHFNLEIGEYTAIEADLPTSVLTALIDKGILPEPYYGENLAHCRTAAALGARFTSTFTVDTLLFGMEHLELRIGGVSAGAVLLINGSPYMRLEYGKLSYTVDIRRFVHLGENTVEIRFDPTEDDIALADISIYGKIELVAYNGKIIDRISLDGKRTDDGFDLKINMATRGRNIPTRAMATLVSPGGSVSYAPLLAGEGEMHIKAPNLWWAGNMGAHNLYRLTVNLYSETELIDSREYRIGLREVGYDAQASRIVLNGRHLRESSLDLARLDMIPTRATDQRARLAVRRASEAGINLLYATASDIYPTRELLYAADEYGVAVAIELTARTKGEGEIEKKLLREEIERYLVSLAEHPSVIMLYGIPEHSDIVTELARSILPSVIYLPDFKPQWNTASPTLPEISTIEEYFPKNARNIFSPALAMRGTGGVEELLFAVVKNYLMPTGFEGWRYLSNFIATRDIREKCARARLNDADRAAPTMSLIPPLPALTPSLLDYSLRVKSAWYAMRKVSLPVIVFGELDGTRVKFYASNMLTNVYIGRLTYIVNDNKNKEILRSVLDFTVEPMTSAVIAEVDFGDVIRGREREYYLYYFASDTALSHSHTTELFIPPRSFDFPEPNISYDIHGAASNYTLTVSSDVFARGVEISFLGDDDVTLSDNYFDITSEVPVRITLTTERPTALETLMKNIRITSFYFASHD